MWIKTKSGYVNSAHVVRMETRQDTGKAVLTMSDGEIAISELTVEQIAIADSPFVAAAEGYYLAQRLRTTEANNTILMGSPLRETYDFACNFVFSSGLKP